MLNSERKFRIIRKGKRIGRVLWYLFLVLASFFIVSALLMNGAFFPLILWIVGVREWIILIAVVLVTLVVVSRISDLSLAKRYAEIVKEISRAVACLLLGFLSFVLLSLLTVIGDTPVWELLELLIVPAVLAFGVWWLRKKQDEIEREIAQDERQQDALQYYLDSMAELLPDLQQNGTEPDGEAQRRARWQVMVAIRVLDGRRKGQILRFLHEHKLITGTAPIIDLRHAELKRADLIVGLSEHWGLGGEWDKDTLFRYYKQYRDSPRWSANLKAVNLNDADLFKAAFVLTNLEGAHLQGAYLANAYLMGANLRGAVLSGADLCGAKLHGADLRGADLTGATVTYAEYDVDTKPPACFHLEAHGARLINEGWCQRLRDYLR